MSASDVATARSRAYTLDPVTFEVVKNSLTTIVDQMGEQILKTCHSFVIYAHDFSSALFDSAGRTVMHGTQDLAGHLGTQHFHAQALLERFGDEMRPGDVYAVNDPYLGGTHFSDVRVMCPIFDGSELIAFAQSSGHWADVGGSAPGSFDVRAREHFGEGLRIPPVRVCTAGTVHEDVIELMIANTRSPQDAAGDMRAQIAATRLAEGELKRLVARYGRETLLAAFAEVQDYVEALVRRRVAALPDGSWETVDYIDCDPELGEGLIPIHVRMTIDGDRLHYDLSRSHAAVGTFLNSAFGASHSAIYAGTKMFFPDIPLNDGFFRPIEVELGPPGSVVNATWPTAVSGFCAGPFEKIMNAIFELWSQVRPERAIACSYNVEYLLSGGRDARRPEQPIFMWYDWVAGGWGGRNGRDGANAVVPVFGTGLTLQPMEGQERLSPVTITEHHLLEDSGGPGMWRGGCGVVKAARVEQAEKAVLSYSCDRARSITWGIEGGLPSLPHGVWHERDGDERFLGVIFSNESLRSGDRFWRPSAGGGGYGDPLQRDPARVREDVADGYVSLARAERDYGVVLRVLDEELGSYEIDAAATAAARGRIASARRGWLAEDAASVAARYRAGELDQLDLVRRYGVIVDWGTGELLERTTATFRAMLERRAVSGWSDEPVRA